MTPNAIKTLCLSLPHSFHVVQWGGADVYKVGRPGAKTSKVFAVAGWQNDKDAYGVSFKCSEIGFEVLSDTPGCRPAPYLASRGMKWIQCFNLEGISRADLEEHLRFSYHLVAAGLPKRLREELGIAG